jgi:O-antigen/teichoic acid export membrane protein
MAKNLKQKAASGMVWTALQKYSKLGIQFVSGIILARLLTPYDYGCIGMLAIFMVVAETFIDGGFGSALIQKKRPTQEDYSTIFYWNMGVATIMYVVLFLSSPAIAKFYKIPVLCEILRVQGLILFIYSLNLIQRNQLKKQLRFKILAIVRIVTSIISLIITIIMAYMGFGVWALVTQNLIGAAIPAIVFWGYTKWRPSWTFSWKSFKELFNFGIFMFMTHLINNISTQLQGLFIGKLYNPSTLGYYSKASGTERLASGTITGVMTAVTYPLYAEVQDDLPKMQNMIKRLTSTISFITFPLLAIFLLVAKPVFVLLYSDRWLESVPYFQVLCFAGLGGCLTSVNTQCIAAIGKSKAMFLWTIIKRIVGVSCILGGLYLFGMYGLLVGVVINYWFSYFVNIWLVSKYIGYKWTTQCLDLLPIALAVMVAGIVSYFCGYMIGLEMYMDGLVKSAVFMFLYVGWFLLVKPESYLYTKGIVSPVIAKFRSKYHF